MEITVIHIYQQWSAFSPAVKATTIVVPRICLLHTFLESLTRAVDFQFFLILRLGQSIYCLPKKKIFEILATQKKYSRSVYWPYSPKMYRNDPPKIALFCNDHPKISKISSYPQNIHFSETPKKCWTQKSGSNLRINENIGVPTHNHTLHPRGPGDPMTLTYLSLSKDFVLFVLVTDFQQRLSKVSLFCSYI